MSKEFEIARLLMMRATLDGLISESRGYAWSARVSPINKTQTEQTFASDFSVSDAQADAVAKDIDAADLAGQPIQFYTLEQTHGPGTATNLSRMEIVAVCRMYFLDSRFTPQTWKGLVAPGSGPIESQGMADPFKASHDLDF